MPGFNTPANLIAWFPQHFTWLILRFNSSIRYVSSRTWLQFSNGAVQLSTATGEPCTVLGFGCIGQWHHKWCGMVGLGWIPSIQ